MFVLNVLILLGASMSVEERGERAEIVQRTREMVRIPRRFSHLPEDEEPLTTSDTYRDVIPKLNNNNDT